MSLQRLLRGSTMKIFLTVQVVFLMMQFFVFYPCLMTENTEHGNMFKKSGNAGVLKMNQKPQVAQKASNADSVEASNVKYTPDWESLDARPIPDWYEDAKVGIFFHWGVYSVPSYTAPGTRGYAEWFWRWWHLATIKDFDQECLRDHSPERCAKDKAAAESVKVYMDKTYPKSFHYTDFAPMFNAELFNPDDWADILKSSGAKYTVLTSKHHEGFTLWGSKRSWNWNAVDNGPHRDLIADLASSVRSRTDLKFGLYHSLYEWFNPLYLEDKENNFTTQVFVRDKLMPELHDMVERFKPDIVWPDGQWEAPCSYWNCTQFLAWLYNDSPVKNTVVTNDRWGKDTYCSHGGFMTCGDYFNPATTGDKVMNRKWENCMTIDKESWGYRRNARSQHYHTMEELTTILAQTVSYGGNMLMNLGPTHDGRIPPLFEERLRQFGDWMRVNGDAIYGTRVWPAHQKDKGNENVFYTRKQNGGKWDVYAILLHWPDDDKLQLQGPIPTAETTVSWLGYTKKKTIDYQPSSSGTGMTINLPQVSISHIPCQWAWTFKLTALKNSD